MKLTEVAFERKSDIFFIEILKIEIYLNRRK